MTAAYALYGISAASAKALALLTVPFLTRALGAEQYGLADLAVSTAALLTLLTQFGGDLPTARRFATASAADRQVLLASYIGAVAAVSTLMGVLLLPLSGLLNDAVLRASEAEAGSLAVLTLLLVPLSATQAALTQVQRIMRRPGRFAILSGVDLLAQLGLAVMFVWLGLGPLGVVLGFVAGSVVGLGVAAGAASTILRVRPAFKVGRSLVSEGLPFLPYVAGFVAADWIVRPIIAATGGSADVGAFGVAVRVASAISLVGTAFAMAWGPYGLGRARTRDTARVFRQTFIAYSGVAIMGATAIAATGPELNRMIAGSGFEVADIVLPGLALAAAVSGLEYILVVTAGITESGKHVAIGASAGAAAQVALAAVFVPIFGMAAVGPAALIGRMVSLALLFSGVRRFLAIGRGAAVAAGMGVLGVGGITQVVIQYGGLGPRLVILATALLVAVAIITKGLLGNTRRVAS